MRSRGIWYFGYLIKSCKFRIAFDDVKFALETSSFGYFFEQHEDFLELFLSWTLLTFFRKA